MPNGSTHLVAGLVGGGIASLVAQKKLDEKREIDWINVVASSGVGLATGRLPDIIEPSFRNPNHRKFFHSYTFGALLFLGGIFIWNKIKERRKERDRTGAEISLQEIGLWIILITIGAYLLHLLMDAFTKKGLPAF